MLTRFSGRTPTGIFLILGEIELHDEAPDFTENRTLPSEPSEEQGSLRPVLRRPRSMDRTLRRDYHTTARRKGLIQEFTSP